MEQKGEFEQRPEIKPAAEVPLPKAKANPLPWIICVVLLIALGGVVAWKFLDQGGTKCETPATGEKASGDVISSETSDEKYATIFKTMNLVKEVKALALKYANGEYSLMDDGYALGYQYEDGYSTNLDWNYGVLVGPANSSNVNEWTKFENRVTKNSAFQSELNAKMKEYGLSEKAMKDGMMDGMIGDGEIKTFASDDGYFCKASTAGSFNLSCGHQSWISEERLALVKELAKAYVASNEKEDDVLFVTALPSDIKTSKSGNYQVISGTVSNGAGVFYRKGTDGEWKYVTGGHVGPDCSIFNTDELKEAFEGYTCFDTGSGAQSTVKR